MSKTLILAALTAAAIASSNDAAFAWSCVAMSSDGAQGWSSNYANERAAERRALRECENFTTSYDCEVQNCVPDNGRS